MFTFLKQQANPQGQQPQQQQYGSNMNRMPMSGPTGGQNMGPGGGQMMPNQGVQAGMRPMGSMGMRPQNMTPPQQQQVRLNMSFILFLTSIHQFIFTNPRMFF